MPRRCAASYAPRATCTTPRCSVSASAASAAKRPRRLPCALTLGLLEEMGRVFLSLEHGVGINADWGMPRTLNAADGLYTLAERTCCIPTTRSTPGQSWKRSAFFTRRHASSARRYWHRRRKATMLCRRQRAPCTPRQLILRRFAAASRPLHEMTLSCSPGMRQTLRMGLSKPCL